MRDESAAIFDEIRDDVNTSDKNIDLIMQLNEASGKVGALAGQSLDTRRYLLPATEPDNHADDHYSSYHLHSIRKIIAAW